MVCGKEAQYSEIIATSANQIVPPKFRPDLQKCCTIFTRPLSYCSVEGGSGDKTNRLIAVVVNDYLDLLSSYAVAQL